jgi:DNA-binding LacI/PurR family transcriptional regulator
LQVADELDWQPSHVARALTKDRAYAVGFVLARPAELLAIDPFFPAFIAGVEAELSARHQALVLQVVPSIDEELAAYQRLAAHRRVDGVIVADLRLGDPRPGFLRAMGLPAVTLGRPQGRRLCPAAVLDDRPGVAAAVEHLADLGHERIAFVGGPDEFLHAHQRRETWRATLGRIGLPPGPAIDGDFSGASGAAATTELLEMPSRRRPTAVMYANDLMAVAGISAAARAGLRVPDDLSIVGFDDVAAAAHVHPPLTTVSQDAVSWGRTATQTLLDAVEHGADHDVELPPARLVVRESTSTLATGGRTRGSRGSPQIRRGS